MEPKTENAKPEPDRIYASPTDAALAAIAHGFNPTPDPSQVERMAAVRDRFARLHRDILAWCPPGRARALALTALEESSMHAIKAIATEGQAAEGPERTRR